MSPQTGRIALRRGRPHRVGQLVFPRRQGGRRRAAHSGASSTSPFASKAATRRRPSRCRPAPGPPDVRSAGRQSLLRRSGRSRFRHPPRLPPSRRPSSNSPRPPGRHEFTCGMGMLHGADHRQSRDGHERRQTLAYELTPTRITLPVEGMTCAACQANVQRALTATPGVTKAAVNLMTHEATVHYDPAATAEPARRRDQRHRLRVALARPRARRGADDDAREQAQRASTRTLLTEVARQPRARRARDGRVDAADGRRQLHTPRTPAIRCCAGPCASSIRRAGRAAVALRDRPAALILALLAATVFVMAWAGPALLHARVAGTASSHRRHEHADRRRHRRGVPLFGRGDVCARLVRRRRRARRCLLRSGDHHHRAGAARQRDGGARQDATRRARCASWPSCSRRPRGCGATARRSTSRSPTSGPAIS